jgi:DNA-binding transcriptional ArsR family regulator
MNPTALDQLPPAALDHVANYFRTLSEPMRLRVLNVLGTRELSVGEIAQQTPSSIANISRHLSQMARHGLIARSSRGNSVYYRIADPAVHDLCDLVCGSIARRYDQALNERAAFAGAHAAAAAPPRAIKRRAPPAP